MKSGPAPLRRWSADGTDDAERSTHDGHDALAALTHESRALCAVLDDLAPAQFERQANCPPWNLRELVVHIGASIRIDGPFAGVDPQAVRFTAADYYRRPERGTQEYR